MVHIEHIMGKIPSIRHIPKERVDEGVQFFDQEHILKKKKSALSHRLYHWLVQSLLTDILSMRHLHDARSAILQCFL